MSFGENRIIRKSTEEIEKMRRSGKMVRQVLNHLKEVVAPGVTTMDLEKAAEKLIAELGAVPAFKGYYGYPCVLCTSINEEIVHGIPSDKRALKTGDIVSIDCGVVCDGYYGDAAITVPVGETLTAELKKLLEVTEASLYEGMVLAIEPMVNSGGPETKVLSDKWTAVTLDGSYSAHFEHCVAVTRQGPVILTQ